MKAKTHKLPNLFLETGSAAQKSLKIGDKARVKQGVLEGVIVTVIQTFEGRGYVMELPDGRQYLYDPVEIDPA